MPKTQNQQIGDAAETQALEYLNKHGLKLIHQNHQNYYGEIDLIMQDQNAMVFVEVRCRQENVYGSSVDTIDPAKQSKIIRTASHYLLLQKLYDKIPCRFDVIAVDKIRSKSSIEWIKNAFEA